MKINNKTKVQKIFAAAVMGTIIFPIISIIYQTLPVNSRNKIDVLTGIVIEKSVLDKFSFYPKFVFYDDQYFITICSALSCFSSIIAASIISLNIVMRKMGCGGNAIVQSQLPPLKKSGVIKFALLIIVLSGFFGFRIFEMVGGKLIVGTHSAFLTGYAMWFFSSSFYIFALSTLSGPMVILNSMKKND